MLYVRQAPRSLFDGHAQGIGQIASGLCAVLQRAGRYFGGSGLGNQGLKKFYLLDLEGKNRDRLLDASKNDIRKYLKRERAKPLPAGVDFWDFDCKLGSEPVGSASVHSAALITGIDSLVAGGNDKFYVEIVAKPGRRTAKTVIEQIPENM